MDLRKMKKGKPGSVIGCGPFKFVEWVPGDHLIMERWEKYFQPGQPYVDRVAIRVIKDPISQMAAFKAGEIDFIASFTPEHVGILKSLNPEAQILTGKETIDFNGDLVGSMIAGHLDLPFIALASHLSSEGGKTIVTRDIEGGTEEIEVTGPFVLSAAKGLAEQRIPNMRGIMSAKTKPLQVIPVASPDVQVEHVQFRTPPAKSAVKLIDPNDMDELVRLLHEEAKVI